MDEKKEISSEEKEEKVEDAEKVEKTEEKKEEKVKDDFEKDSEVVPAGKYNQAVRKQRELELEKREVEKQLAEAKIPAKKEESKDEEEEDDDFFEEDEKKPKKKEKLPDISSLIDEKVKPVLERLNQKEASDRKNQRTAFFEAHPEYLTNSEAWQELLDEMDNSLNPHSKNSYYDQLVKAHRLLGGSNADSDVDKKKRELASESSSKNDGANKVDDGRKAVDERAERLAKMMPIGYEYKK